MRSSRVTGQIVRALSILDSSNFNKTLRVDETIVEGQKYVDTGKEPPSEVAVSVTDLLDKEEKQHKRLDKRVDELTKKVGGKTGLLK
jgi:hypothetical protein